MFKRTFGILLPTLLLVCAVGTGGSQQQPSSSGLFDPVYQIYQYVQSYFYKPAQIDDQKALYGAMKGVVQQLDDPYSEFLDPEEKEQFDESLEGEFSGVGIEISIEDGVLTVITPLVGTPAEAAGILAGDQILAIDGETTEKITLTGASCRIRGEIGTTVTLTLRHEDGEVVDIPIVRNLIVIDPVDSSTLEGGKIGYIRILRFESDTVIEVDQALASFDLETMSGLILDLRNNPGGLMPAAISVCSRFVDDGVVLLVHDRLSGDKKYYSKGNRIPNLPLAILINRGSASAAEITAGGIRDNRMAVLIGETSFGKGVYQQMIDFPDGSALKITAGEYFTPSGRVVQDVGLSPDIVVPEGEDPVAAAIQWIGEQNGGRGPLDLPPLAEG
ncbi:MAG: S41 family peptidase [Candidatus Bipolaricaulis sp.]|nr:S41 family peptidase [Candidatus Bipolaricaulis sp.]MDD5219415.1 S41 family peptidase [Candidatus Bipolaricaulis sp.]